MLIVALCSIISMDIENSKLNHWISWFWVLIWPKDLSN
jgi:FtsH-binding integral membrane protein